MSFSEARTFTESGRGFDRLPPAAALAPVQQAEPPAPTPCPRCGRYPWEPCNGAGVRILGCARGRLEGDGSRRARGDGTYEVRP